MLKALYNLGVLNLKTTCKKVLSLLSAYIENKLDIEDKLFIENHFIQCESCHQKYLEMKNVINNLHKDYSKLISELEQIESNRIFSIREYESFYSNISPYIDDELCYNDSIKFRRYLLKSKPARIELAQAYNLKNNIKHSITNYKDSIKINFSPKIIKRLRNENNSSFEIIYRKAAIVLGVMVSLLLFFSIFIGYNYINEAFAQNKENNVVETEFPKNINDLVEFSFDENNEVILTLKWNTRKICPC